MSSGVNVAKMNTKITTMTSEQIEKIKVAAREIRNLSKEQDRVYSKLIKDLEFERYEQPWSNGTDPANIKHNNPTGYLFDVVYNTILEEEDDIELSLKKLLAAKEAYDNYGNV